MKSQRGVRQWLACRSILLGLNLLVMLLAGGCARSVHYGWEASSNNAVMSSDITRLYFDRQGDLYPDAAALLAVDNQRLDYHGSALQFYYQVETKRKWADRQQREYQQLHDYYGVRPAAQTDNDSLLKRSWLALQDSMQTRGVRRFARHLRDTRADALVVLVHGFNNEVGSTRWFPALQRQIREGYFAGKRVHFLEVYWDGRTAGGVGVLPIWLWAQGTMYPTALSLRRFLSKVDPAMPTYLIGHSTGAPLVCATLWNSTSALSDSATFNVHPEESYLSLLSQPRYATPRLAHVRVALVAPAMPSRHFQDIANRTDAAGTRYRHTGPDGYERFVVAHNRHDIATGKGPAPSNAFGSSRLGVKKDEFCGDNTPGSTYGVVPLLRRAGSPAQAYLVNLTPGMAARSKHRSAHGVLQFMDDEATFKCLLDGWLTDMPPPCADACP